MTVNQPYYYGTGKRKMAIARVRLMSGTGVVVVNGKPFEEAFPREGLQSVALTPLRLTNTLNQYNVMIKVAGGGFSGQAGAMRHGIARALLRTDETLRPVLKRAGLLTRDPRVKERKKYGLKRARKAPQYTKR